MARRYEVGAYYFPNYHADARNEAAHGRGWTEWELMKRAEPRFAGHDQPKTPLWGYEDEADPQVMARKIDAAADHGINHFLFDWYWYEDGPFLSRALDEGFLRAANNHRLKFALMWANHDWYDIHPARYHGKNPLLYKGTVSRGAFDRATGHVIERYFRHPSCWLVKGRPYFSIYEIETLVRGLGGIDAAREALADFRRRTQEAGFPDLHLNAVYWGVGILPGEQAIREPKELLSTLGFDSVSSYVWVHHARLSDFPVTDYAAVAEQAAAYWREAREAFGLPYHPNVTMGWDSSPRCAPSDTWENVGYPFMPILSGNTPERFRDALERAKAFLDEQESDADGPAILSINAWNEWTEGSYLEPDTTHGMAYLEAVRNVFENASRTA